MILYHYCSKEDFEKALDPLGIFKEGKGNLGLAHHDGTTDTGAHQIWITSAAHKHLDSLASELRKTLRAVASVILCHYCSKEDFEKARGG